MEREVIDFWREICITRASYRGGPKKVKNSGPTPITGPSNAYFPPEIHYFQRHKKNRCIGNFMYMRLGVVPGPTTVCYSTVCMCGGWGVGGFMYLI
jgi:hypothetical protein